LEAENARLKLERDLYKSSVNALVREHDPYVPLTAKEQEDLMNAPEGESIQSILEEYERKYRDRL